MNDQAGIWDARPAWVASRLIESSASALARTWPTRAMTVPAAPLMATPLASTSATVIWIEAWSLAVMSRPAKSRKGQD